MKHTSFLNTWFINISLEDINKYFADNFQAIPQIVDTFHKDNTFVIQFACKDIADNSKFSVYMNEYGFYDLNKDDELVFNVLNKRSDYLTQTENLARLLAYINDGEKINGKTYPEAFTEFHRNMRIKMDKEMDQAK